MTAASSFVLAAVLLAGASAPSGLKPVNRGGAPGLIQAASQFVAVDLLDGKDGHIRGSLTPTEVKKLGELVRAGSAREVQTMGAQWTSVMRIQTRSRGIYVVYLMDPDTLRLEIPVGVARQLGVADGIARYKRIEVQLGDASWLYDALGARLGPSDVLHDLPPNDLTPDEMFGKAPTKVSGDRDRQ